MLRLIPTVVQALDPHEWLQGSNRRLTRADVALGHRASGG